MWLFGFIKLRLVHSFDFKLLCIKETFSLLNRLKSLGGKGADNVNIATISLFGNYYAATETPQVIKYDPLTLGNSNF